MQQVGVGVLTKCWSEERRVMEVSVDEIKVNIKLKFVPAKRKDK